LAFTPPPFGLAVTDLEPVTVVVVVGAAGVAGAPVVLPGMRFEPVMVVGDAGGLPAASRAR
jgi:hypothetical protein